MVPLRVAVIALIFANLLALALWKGWLGGGPSHGEPERVSNQLSPDRIRLVPDARPAPPKAAPAPVAAAPVPPPAAPAVPETTRAPAPAVESEAPPACVAFTGLGVDQSRELAARIAKAGGGFKLTENRSEQPSSWWVFIPPQGSKEGAERKAAEVRSMGVEDLFIVPDAGASQYAISLGLFKSEQAASRQLASLRAKGVRTAQVATRGTVQVSMEIRGPSDRLSSLASDLSEGMKGARRQGCNP